MEDVTGIRLIIFPICFLSPVEALPCTKLIKISTFSIRLPLQVHRATALVGLHLLPLRVPSARPPARPVIGHARSHAVESRVSGDRGDDDDWGVTVLLRVASVGRPQMPGPILHPFSEVTIQRNRVCFLNYRLTN